MGYSSEATAALQNLIDHSVINDAVEHQIRQLIKEGADISISTSYGKNTLLLWAIVYNRTALAADLIPELYKKHKEVLDFKDTFRLAGNTALMLAIKKGFYDIARQLLAVRVNPNIDSDTDHLTPLHIACGLLGTSYEETASFLGKVHRNYTREEPLIN